MLHGHASHLLGSEGFVLEIADPPNNSQVSNSILICRGRN